MRPEGAATGKSKDTAGKGRGPEQSGSKGKERTKNGKGKEGGEEKEGEKTGRGDEGEPHTGAPQGTNPPPTGPLGHVGVGRGLVGLLALLAISVHILRLRIARAFSL